MDTQAGGQRGCDGPRSNAKLDSFPIVASIYIPLPSELEIPLQEHAHGLGRLQGKLEGQACLAFSTLW